MRVLARSLVLVAALTAVAHAADNRELKAREAYAAGNYQVAVELYSKLYASTLHPTYLRNIGRCYQNLDEPDRAIKSFQEYLRKAKVNAAERREVEAYIAEMEALKKQRAQPVPASPPAASVDLTARAPDLTVRAPEPRPVSPPLYERWWFWTGIGVVAAGAATAYMLSTRSDAPSTDYGPYSPSWK